MKKTKQILAIAGIVLLVGMYLVTLVLGLTASPATQGMLMASIACTIVIPILLYAFMLVARVLGGRGKEEPHNSDETPKKSK